MLAIYDGVVCGHTVELPPDTRLAEGSVVEVRPTDAELTDEEADRLDQEALVAAGLLREIRPLSVRSPIPDPPLVIIDGPPVAQSIIDERR